MPINYSGDYDRNRIASILGEVVLSVNALLAGTTGGHAPAGPVGAPGATGPAGYSATGATGLAGATGATGPAGVPATTFDPATLIGGALSNGNLTWTHDGITNNAGVKITSNKTTGKWYFEVHIDTLGSNNLFGVGAMDTAAAISTATSGLGSHGASAYFNGGPIYVNGSQPGNVTFNGGQRTPAGGDWIGVGIDVDNHTIQLNNITTGGTSSGTVTMITEANYLAAVFAGTTDSPAGAVTANFGATAFQGTPFAGYTAWG